MTIAEFMRRMLELGAPPEAIALAVEAIEDERRNLEAAMAREEERRKGQRDRKRRSRHRHGTDAAPSGDGPETVTGQGRDGDATVTDRGRDPSPPPVSPQTPLPSSPSTSAVVDGARARLDLTGHLPAAEEIWKVIGVVEDPTWFAHKGRVAQWLVDWDLDLDILPVVRSLMATRKARGEGAPSSPMYFERAIADARRRRLAPLPTGATPQPSPVRPTVDLNAVRERLRAETSAPSTQEESHEDVDSSSGSRPEMIDAPHSPTEAGGDALEIPAFMRRTAK